MADGLELPCSGLPASPLFLLPLLPAFVFVFFFTPAVTALNVIINGSYVSFFMNLEY